MRPTAKLRTLLNSGRITVAPGAYDGLSARLVEQAGFPAIYASGGAIALPKSIISGVGALAFFRDTEGNVFGAIQFDPRRE